MNIPIDNYHIFSTLETGDATGNNIPVLFLHGFTGSSSDWIHFFPFIKTGFLPFAIDLIGHGKSSSPVELTPYTSESLVDQINSVIEFHGFEQVILCGYSMGGRAALLFATEHPEKVKGLILESSSPGLIIDEERSDRYIKDLNLAEKILIEGVNSFIKYWYNIPLFNSLKHLPDNGYQNLLKKRKANSKIGLSNSLRGFSTGLMPNLWNRLEGINFPVLLLCGESDEKFTEINTLMNTIIPDSYLHILTTSGHNTHLEKPEEFVSLLNSFLRTFL